MFPLLSNSLIALEDVAFFEPLGLLSYVFIVVQHDDILWAKL